MKEVLIEKRLPISLIIILLIICIPSFIIVLKNSSGISDIIGECLPLLFLIAILVVGVILDIRDRLTASLILKMKLYKDKIVFEGLEKGKKVKSIIPIEKIKSFHLHIIGTKDGESLNSRSIISIRIEVDDNSNTKQIYTAKNVYENFIKKIFKIAKFIPNFTYSVESETLSFKTNVDTLYNTGKELSVKENFRVFFNDPSISDDKKTLVRILQYYGMFWGIILIFMTINLIVYIIKMFN